MCLLAICMSSLEKCLFMNLCLLHWQADSLLLSHQGSLPSSAKVTDLPQHIMQCREDRRHVIHFTHATPHLFLDKWEGEEGQHIPLRTSDSWAKSCSFCGSLEEARGPHALYGPSCLLNFPAIHQQASCRRAKPVCVCLPFALCLLYLSA